MNTWWYLSKDKQCRPLPGGPYLPRAYEDPTCPGGGGGGSSSWLDLTDVPACFPPCDHTHSWSDLTDVPDEFPPEAHTHDWEDISDWGFGALRDPVGCVLRDPAGVILYPPGAPLPGPCGPETWPPDAHTHLWADITDPPATFPPEAHTHPWTDITDTPATFPPEVHTHPWTDITDTPACFTPCAHTHEASDFTSIFRRLISGGSEYNAESHRITAPPPTESADIGVVSLDGGTP